MDRFTPSISADHVAASLRYPIECGVDTALISSKAKVDLSDLFQRNAPFSLDEVMRLIQVGSQELGMPHYGLVNGNYMSLSCHGLAGLSAMSQNTYAQCLQAASRLCDVIFPPLVMDYFETKTSVGVRVYECLSLAPHTRYFLEWIMTNYRNIFRFLVGEEYEPQYVAFPYSAPDYLDVYKRYLPCDLIFNAEHAEFVVAKSVANKELALANQAIANSAETKLFNAMRIEDFDCVVRRARAILVKSIEEMPSMEEVAERLGMSSRTLRRQLGRQGTSYKELVNDLRRETTISQLAYSDKSITSIGSQLGYCDTAAFSNAFKRWTGQTPRQFRTIYGILSKNNQSL